MSKIVAGDLVVVTHKHCADGGSIGKIFTVTRVAIANGRCTACNAMVRQVEAAVDGGRTSEIGKLWAMPISYLTKIEPLPASELRERMLEEH